jgi:hypothetical protein
MLINYTQLNTKNQRTNSNTQTKEDTEKNTENDTNKNKETPIGRFIGVGKTVMAVNAVKNQPVTTKANNQTRREQALTDFLKSIDDDLLSNSIPLYNTGLDLYYTPPSGKSKYEIHIYMDLVEGKLTKDILSKTSCFFKDNQLVNLFYNVLNINDTNGAYVMGLGDKFPSDSFLHAS